MTNTYRNIEFLLNDKPLKLQVGTHQTLIELLHSRGLTGARESCAQGLCGCCTVRVNEMVVSGCLYLAIFADGKRVQTIEAGSAEKLDDVQQAFIECGAFQCGYCTPGFVLMVRELLNENLDPSDQEIGHYLSGNLCRCATYPEIINAVKRVVALRRGES